MNKAMLIGNLGQDPVVKTTPSGKKVATFSLATSKKVKDQTVTQWHNIVVWDKLADICEKYLKKGSKIYAEGEINYRSYEAKDGGGTKYVTEINMYQMEMLSAAQTAKVEDADVIDDDLPADPF